MIDGSELNVTVGDIFEFKPRTFLFSAVVLPRFFSFDISSYYAPTSLKFFRSNDQYSQWRGSCSGLIKKANCKFTQYRCCLSSHEPGP